MNEFFIERLGHLGDGFATHAGQPVQAQFVLPGELVSGEVDGQYLRNVKIINPVEDRVKAPCRHFKACGGCVMQHASNKLQAEWKTQTVLKALNDHGIVSEVRPIYQVAMQSRRRLSLKGKRTKKSSIIGFHRSGSNEFVEVAECEIADPNIGACFDVLRRIVRLAASRKSEVSVHITAMDNGLDLAIDGAEIIKPEDIANLGEWMTSVNILRCYWNGQLLLQLHEPLIDMDGTKVCPPSGAFLQPSQEGEAFLANLAKEFLSNCKHIVDIFSGCGTFTFPLAKTSKVTAFEGDTKLISSLNAAAAGATGIRPVSGEVRDLFRNPLLPKELEIFDGAVIDPPRAGAEAQIGQVVQSKLKSLCYVSCNPASFARDAKKLIDAGFTLEFVQPVDQFRFSSHVELIAGFTKS